MNAKTRHRQFRRARRALEQVYDDNLLSFQNNLDPLKLTMTQHVKIERTRGLRNKLVQAHQQVKIAKGRKRYADLKAEYARVCEILKDNEQ